MGDDGVNRFEVGPTYCGLTLRLAEECQHCQELAKRPPGPTRKVVAVDRDTGTITITSEPDE